jgi:MscS family membrane protein
MISVLLAAAVKTQTVQQVWSDSTFGLSRVEVLHRQVAGRPLWQYAATVLWILMAFLVAQAADYVMTRWVKKLTAKTETDLDDKLLEILHRPLRIVVTLLVLRVGLQVFSWPNVLEKVLAVCFVTGMAITGIYVAMRFLDLLLDGSRGRLFAGDERLAGMMLPIMSRTLKAFVLITGALTTAQYLGVPITSVIAGLGVGGIAVALAAQNTLANIFGSITILIDRPFRVGDVVKIQEFEGNVEEIGLRSTKIRTADGHLVTLPNKVVVDAGITNIARRPTIRRAMTIGLTYDTPAERVQEAVKLLREIFQKHPLTHEVWVYWRDYSASSLDIFVVYWCKSTDMKTFLEALDEINVEIKRRFDASGLKFAFPTQTIHLHQEP